MIGLSGSFGDGQGAWLFSNIHLELVETGWTCLLGPSGVGKTTVLRLIAGLKTHGEFRGDLEKLGRERLPDAAYMAQQDLLLPWLDVSKNVCLGTKLRNEPVNQVRVDELIERVGLSDHRHKTPAELSGGMRQRAALARTLMEDRELVLLDEPFSALDARTRAEMQELAHETLAGKTVLLVTHDPAEAARMGDRNYILDEIDLREIDSKATKNILPSDAPQSLKLQAKLLAQLRGTKQ